MNNMNKLFDGNQMISYRNVVACLPHTGNNVTA